MTESPGAGVPAIVLRTAVVGVSVQLCTEAIGGNGNEEDQGREEVNECVRHPDEGFGVCAPIGEASVIIRFHAALRLPQAAWAFTQHHSPGLKRCTTEITPDTSLCMLLTETQRIMTTTKWRLLCSMLPISSPQLVLREVTCPVGQATLSTQY